MGSVATAARALAAIAAIAAALASAGGAASNGFLLTQISTDPFTNPTSQHATQVEPDSFAAGDTVVAAFQTGRHTDGGASGIAFSTSKDGGRTWTADVLPLLTKHTVPPGPYDRATDPSVAYDAAHGTWLVSSLVLAEPCPSGASSCRSAVVVSRSSDGLSWSAPVTVLPLGATFAADKNWTACDNWAGSPYRGRCYTSWSDFTNGRQIVTSSSSDGGLTWTTPVASPDTTADGLGAIPVARPDGRLVIVFLAGDAEDRIGAIVSTDGGASFSNRLDVAPAPRHRPTGMRGRALPTVEVDGAGTIYAAWDSCYFRPGCPANDIVLTRSSDGVSWSPVARVPIDAADSGIDHFVPGLAVDASTSGASARLGLVYYSFPVAACAFADCQLRAGFVSSTNGGATWEQPLGIDRGPMALSSLPDTSQGRMVGDYVSASFVSGGAVVPVYPLSTPHDGSFHQSMHAARIELVASSPSPPPAPPSPSPPSPPPAPAPPVPPAPQQPSPSPPGVSKLLLSPLSWSPAQARAGRRFSVRVRARAGARTLESGRALCTARLTSQRGKRTLPVASRTLRRGVVTCVWRIPAGASGQRLTVGAGASSSGRAAKRARTFRVVG